MKCLSADFEVSRLFLILNKGFGIALVVTKSESSYGLHMT